MEIWKKIPVNEQVSMISSEPASVISRGRKTRSSLGDITIAALKIRFRPNTSSMLGTSHFANVHQLAN